MFASTPTHLTSIATAAAVAATIILIAHICVFFLAQHNHELRKFGRIGWSILAVVFLFIPVFLASPIPFYFFFSQYNRKWRLFGILTLAALLVLDGIIIWAHLETDENFNRSVAIARFFPDSVEGWTIKDLPDDHRPFISVGLTVQPTALRTYTVGSDHKVMLMITASPLAIEARRALRAAVDPRITPEEAKQNGITIKDNGYTFIKDCLTVYDRDGIVMGEPALVMLAGDYTIIVGSATEPEDTLEQLANAVKVYELRRAQP